MKYNNERMKDLRISLNMSQEELANKIGYSRQQLISWEKGKSTPALDSISKIAKALGVPAQFLISED